MRVVTGSELKEIEEYAINELKLPSAVLMERAALSVYELICNYYDRGYSVIVIAGVGNNGADGVAIARMLHIAGYKVAIKIVGDMNKATKEFKLQYEIYNKLNGKVLNTKPDYKRYDIAVDALFGIGLTREVVGEYKEVIGKVNEAFENKVVFSVDIPSGIDADTGKVMGTCIKATYTVTFSCMKAGMLLSPGNKYVGKVVISDIGIPESAYKGNCSIISYIDREELKLPKRDINGNKGTFGKILIIAGSYDMSGAAYLCAKAAFRSGCGLVKIVTVNENREVLQRMLPEAILMTYNREESMDLSEALSWADSIVIGPGIGTGDISKNLLQQVMKSGKKLVIDADGLNIISNDNTMKKLFGNNMIITPHIGEMSRLCKKSIDEIKENMLDVATEFAKQHNIVVVLKDSRTVVSDGKMRYINISGNDGMATAGSGDVLAGIVGSLYATDNSAFNSASNAVYLHGEAGDAAAKRIGSAGLMASDIAEMLEVTLV